MDATSSPQRPAPIVLDDPLASPSLRAAVLGLAVAHPVGVVADARGVSGR